MPAMDAHSNKRQPRSVARTAIITAGLAIAIAMPAAALAGKAGGSSGSPWISLSTVSGQSVAAAAMPRVGSAVKFASGYPSTTRNPWVSLTCYQGGSLVYGEGGAPNQDFLLGGATSDWAATGGAATCRAELGDLYWRGGKQYYTYLAHTNFEAGG